MPAFKLQSFKAIKKKKKAGKPRTSRRRLDENGIQSNNDFQDRDEFMVP